MAEKKIYLFCVAGMSTSLLAKNIQDAANAHNLPIKVEAYTAGKINQIVESEHPDCILLGPQVSNMFEGINERYGKEHPVAVIDQGDYGRLDGERVLKSAVLLMKKFKSA